MVLGLEPLEERLSPCASEHNGDSKGSTEGEKKIIACGEGYSRLDLFQKILINLTANWLSHSRLNLQFLKKK